MNLFPFISAIFCIINGIAGITIISKAEWGGRAASSNSSLDKDLAYVIIHHSAGAYCDSQTTCSAQMRNMQTYHMKSLDWPYIGYNFGIGADGNIYEGRGAGIMGDHAFGWNRKSYGIVFIGNYNDYNPSAAQIEKVHELIDWLVKQGFVASTYTLYGHRQVRATECPGNNLYAVIKTWPKWQEQISN